MSSLSLYFTRVYATGRVVLSEDPIWPPWACFAGQITLFLLDGDFSSNVLTGEPVLDHRPTVAKPLNLSAYNPQNLHFLSVEFLF